MPEFADEAEARALLAKRVDELAALGFEALRARSGPVKRSWFGGRLKFYGEGEDVIEEVTGPSGIEYQFEILVHESGDDELNVSVEILEGGEASLVGGMVEGFDITADGRVLRF